jgi:ferric-dicitrate binding protein FerR (iron transport regulator)
MEENYTLAKWLNNELEGEELKSFEASEDFAVYQKIKNYSAQLQTPDFDEQKMLQKVLKQPKASSKVVGINTWFLRIAAVVVLSLGITFALRNFATATEVTNSGTTAQFLLPDNSEVVLNSGSEIEYNKWNWNNNRKLSLDGEAYFKVAKGKTFEVETSLGKVTVLGTQFNVKNRKNRIDVTCYEGKVQVNYQKEQLILTPGQSVAFANGDKIEVTNPDKNQPEWLNKQVKFSKENLTAIIEELNRQYATQIEYKGKPTNQVFTGIVPTDDLEVALEIIATTYHLKISKISDSKIVLQ